MTRFAKQKHREEAARGHSLIELLFALTICALVSAGFAAVVPPARAAFETTPALLDLQQRGRTAADVLAQAIRGAGGEAIASNELGPLGSVIPSVIPLDASNGRFTRLRVIAPLRDAAQGVLDRDQAGGGVLFLNRAACPAVPAVCGFVPAAPAIVFDGSGRFDLFTVAAVDTTLGNLATDRWLASPYAAGSAVLEAEVYTLELQVQSDGSQSLVRVTAAGAVQPIVDHVGEMTFELWGFDPFHALVPMPAESLADGPWLRGDPYGVYDEDLFRVRRVDVTLTLLAAPPSEVRRAFRFGVFLRNVP